MYRPSKEQEAELAYNVRQYFKRPEGRDYFRKSRATEQTARGTQIKNYYGLMKVIKTLHLQCGSMLEETMLKILV